jgi:hypothetical protein
MHGMAGGGEAESGPRLMWHDVVFDGDEEVGGFGRAKCCGVSHCADGIAMFGRSPRLPYLSSSRQ